MHFCGCYVFLMPQTGRNFNIISIFGVNFWSKFRYLTPWGAPLYGSPNYNAIHIEDIVSWLNLNVVCGYYVLFNGPNLDEFSILSIFWVIFGQN